MDIQSSQPRNDSTSVEKKRQGDGCNVIADQAKAVELLKDAKIRKFRYEDVTIETISGELLHTNMWVTDEQSYGLTEKKVEIFKCSVCGKEYDKNQKLLLHARYHK